MKGEGWAKSRLVAMYVGVLSAVVMDVWQVEEGFGHGTRIVLHVARLPMLTCSVNIAMARPVSIVCAWSRAMVPTGNK